MLVLSEMVSVCFWWVLTAPLWGQVLRCLLLHGESPHILWGCDLDWDRELAGVCPAVVPSSNTVMI